MWSFQSTASEEQNEGSKLSEFFNNQGVATSLVRESLQNSLDAKRDECDLVRVKFSFKSVPPKELEDYCKSYESDDKGIGLSKHLASNDLGKYKLKIEDKPIHCLLIEDYGTHGLTGSLDKDDPWAKSNFVGFWWNIGLSNKPGANGSHGVGKTTLTSSSQALTFLALTNRSDDGEKYLIGFSNLPPHRIGKKNRYRGYGRYGLRQDSLGLAPVSDIDKISDFEKSFGLVRNEPGLSVLIPWLSNDVSPDEIKSAVLADYYWPILNGQLIVEIEDKAQGTSVLIKKETIKDLSKDEVEKTSGLVRFAEAALKLRDGGGNPNYFAGIEVEEKAKANGGIEGHISEKCFTEENLLIAQNAFKNGEIVGFGLCLPVQKIGEETRTAVFDVFVQRDDDTKNLKVDQFIRKQIVISKEKSGIAGGFNRSMQHTVRTSLLVFGIARSFLAAH